MARAESVATGAGPQRPPHDAPAAARDGLVVHVVGRLTAKVAGFLLPTIRVVAERGAPQALVFVDDVVAAGVTSRVPPGVRLVPVADRPSALGRSAALHEALERLAAQAAPSVLHLHGLLPGLAAARWLRYEARGPVDVVFSPHASRALARGRLLRFASGTLLRIGLGAAARGSIVNLGSEAGLVRPLRPAPVRVVESPVHGAFLECPRDESPAPVLLSCAADEGTLEAVDGFVRTAVLFNDERLGFAFRWGGTVTPEAADALAAAGAERVDADDESARVALMRSAWVYLALHVERGFPVRLVEAMAAGTPCVALDAPVHREIVRDGVTGFLCADPRSALQRIAELVDDPARRAEMGRRARAEARARFSYDVFDARLAEAYALAARTPASPATPAAAQG